MGKGAIKYHTGYLMRDRLYDDDLDSRAWKLARQAEQGFVHLLQRRIAWGVFEYWALPVRERLVAA